ncbi:hypothetical protein GCM10017687_58730 [Streptomyces echinatus]|uniref:Transposase IS4-like domain-containing protein n=1 Tax=Streptomyces echinatus TaxID=67293 RepID=A0A7W9PR86_9ACTN|nr:hypothetical protein [Streptomyces echinatus]
MSCGIVSSRCCRSASAASATCGRLFPCQGLKRGQHTGPSPVDRGRAGSKHHLITDGHGTPLAVLLTGGNRNDVTQLLPLLDAIPLVRGRIGRPRRRPDSLFADRGYDMTATATKTAPEASSRRSPAVGPGTALAWASTVGWSNGP